MRGHPRECEFIVGEGNDYGPIQQSYELRKLRQENQRLKARLQAACLPHSDDEAEQDAPTDRRASRQATRASVARQRGYKSADRVDNLYFGTPGLPSIITDVGRASLIDFVVPLTRCSSQRLGLERIRWRMLFHTLEMPLLLATRPIPFRLSKDARVPLTY